MLSCSQEDITSNFEKLPINISVGQQTRANDSTFENEDEVGIYVVNYDGSTAGTLAASGNQVDNERFTYNNGAWTPDETIYWKDQSTAADFYAYYPYSESVDISAHPFSVMADQSTEDNFWASDFLWGKATKVTPTSAAVPVVTNHSLSKILLAIEPGNGFTEESWAAATKSVKICNVKTNATIDLASGVATATGDDGEIVPFLSVPTTSGVKPSYKAMIVPQTIADNSKLIVVTVDGTEYVYRTGITFKANTQHRFVVTVNKKGGNVDVTIGEWEMDENINEGNAEEEVTTAETIPNNQIWYATSDGNSITPYRGPRGATLISNTYNEHIGKWVLEYSNSFNTIEVEAFMGCTTLTNIIFPEGVTTFCEDSIPSVKEITIPSSVNNIFYGAIKSVGKINICDLTTWCKIDKGNNNFGSSNRIFLNGSELTILDIPTEIATIKYKAFYYCTSIKKINTHNNVTTIGNYAFSNNSNLEDLTIGTNVQSIGCYAFSNANITSLTIPASVNEIYNSAFRGCSKLETIYCLNPTPPTAHDISDSDDFEWRAFDFISASATIYVPRESVDAYKSATGWSDYADCIVGYDF